MKELELTHKLVKLGHKKVDQTHAFRCATCGQTYHDILAKGLKCRKEA